MQHYAGDVSDAEEMHCALDESRKRVDQKIILVSYALPRRRVDNDVATTQKEQCKLHVQCQWLHVPAPVIALPQACASPAGNRNSPNSCAVDAAARLGDA